MDSHRPLTGANTTPDLLCTIVQRCQAFAMNHQQQQQQHGQVLMNGAGLTSEQQMASSGQGAPSPTDDGAMWTRHG